MGEPGRSLRLAADPDDADARAEWQAERLREAGWKRQFTASGQRLDEMVELYTAMGMEVHLEPLVVEETDNVDPFCTTCVETSPEGSSTVWTRTAAAARRAAASGDDAKDP